MNMSLQSNISNNKNAGAAGQLCNKEEDIRRGIPDDDEDDIAVSLPKRTPHAVGQNIAEKFRVSPEAQIPLTHCSKRVKGAPYDYKYRSGSVAYDQSVSCPSNAILFSDPSSRVSLISLSTLSKGSNPTDRVTAFGGFNSSGSRDPLTSTTRLTVGSDITSPGDDNIDEYRSTKQSENPQGPDGDNLSGSVDLAANDDTVFGMHRQNIRALSLIVCTFTYLMIGAAIFDALESEADSKNFLLVKQMEDKMHAKYNFTEKDKQILELVIIKSIPHKAGRQWRFAGAFYFATVVITTVGYGHSTPATTEGKLFCIFYALCGIPLNLVMFQSIGERLNTLISYCLTKLRRLLRLARPQDVSMSHMITVSGAIGTSVMILGTYAFNSFEGWDYLDSFYYCFVTLTTIGFGDYVAMQTNDSLSKKPGYVVFSLVFILFGMAIFAASVNLFVLRFMATSSDNESMDKDQVKTVVLRDLNASDEDLATPNGSVTLVAGAEGSLKMAPRISKRSVDIPSPVYTNVPSSQLQKGRCLCQCYRCFFRKHNDKQHYTVRRAPTRISHLLNPNAVRPDAEPSPSETDSFLMYELSRRHSRNPSI